MKHITLICLSILALGLMAFGVSPPDATVLDIDVATITVDTPAGIGEVVPALEVGTVYRITAASAHVARDTERTGLPNHHVTTERTGWDPGHERSPTLTPDGSWPALDLFTSGHGTRGYDVHPEVLKRRT